MRSGTPIRRSPAAAIEILLGTRMQAKSGACHRKQRPGSLSTRYTKGVPIPRLCKINRQPELIESCVSRSKQSPLPKINRQLSGTRSFRLSALLVTRHLPALPALTKEGSAREGSLVTAFLIETRTGLFGCGVLGGGGDVAAGYEVDDVLGGVYGAGAGVIEVLFAGGGLLGGREIGAGGIDDDLDGGPAGIRGCCARGLARADGLELGIVKAETVDEVIAHDGGAGLRQHQVFGRVTGHAGGNNDDGDAKLVVGEELAGGTQRFLVLGFGGIHFFEKLLGLVSKSLQRLARGELRNFVFREAGGIFVATLFVKAADKETLLQCFHVFLEVGDARLRVDDGVAQPSGCLVELVVEFFVVDESAGGALAAVNFGAD